MSRFFSFALSSGLAFEVGSVAEASAKKTDPTETTCDESLSMSEGEQPVAAAFLEGWRNGRKNVQLGEVGLDREVTTLVVFCEEAPKESPWRLFEKHVPVLKKQVKPIEMKCEDFVGLESHLQPELYYYLDGYDRATRTRTDVASEVDLEQDHATFIPVCEQAPKESLWARIKAHFQTRSE